MKSALRILLKDVGKFWPVILLSVVVRIFGYCLALSNLDAARYFSGLGPGLAKLFQMAPLMQWVMVYLLSVWVVLEDRAVGDRVAWMTRPIRARDMLFAKFSFLVLGIAFPAGFVSAGVALWLHAPLSTAMVTGLSNFLFTLFATTIFASIAVVCASMIQAMLITAGIIVGIAVTNFVIFQVAHLSMPEGSTGVSSRTNFIVAVGLTIVSGIATLGYQYTTRRVIHTIMVATVLCLVSAGLVHWWPLSILSDLQARAQVSATPVNQLTLQPTSGPADFTTNQRQFGDSEAYVTVPLQIEGAPLDRSFVVHVISSNLVLDNGATVSTQHLYDNHPFEGEFAAAAALGFAVPSRVGLRNIAVVKCPLDQFRELQGQSGKLTAQFLLIESHYETVARLPVRSGAEQAADGHLARIFSIQFFDGACDIGFRFAIVNPTLGTRQPIWPYHYVLVNTKRGEYSDSHGGNSRGTGGPEISLVTSHSRFTETRSMQGSEIAGKVDAAWLEGAELYFLVGKEVDRAQRSFAMDRLTIPTKQLTRHFIVINPDGTRNEYDR